MQQVTLVAILTTRCNNRCLNCVRVFNPNARAARVEELTEVKLKKIIRDLHDKSEIKQVIFTGGEPLLLYIEEFLHTLLEFDIRRVHIQTNGTFIRNTIDTFIKYKRIFKFSFLVSIYGTDEHEYQKYTKTNNWRIVWSGIEILKATGLSYQIGVISDNIENLVDFPQSHEYIAILPHQIEVNKAINWIIKLHEILGFDNIYIEGLPPCFFPQYYDKFVSLKWPSQFIIAKPNGSTVKAPPFDYMYKSKTCHKCIFNKLCPGIYREYSSLLESILSNHPLIIRPFKS